MCLFVDGDIHFGYRTFLVIGNEMKVLCILAKKNESVTIFRIVKIIDPNAFVSQSSVIGVYGEGFDEMKVKIKDKDIKTIKS